MKLVYLFPIKNNDLCKLSDIWGNYVKIWYFVNNFLIKARI